jgi:hypothetical protein
MTNEKAEQNPETPTFEQRLLEGRDTSGIELVAHFSDRPILSLTIPGTRTTEGSTRMFQVVGNTIEEIDA